MWAVDLAGVVMVVVGGTVLTATEAANLQLGETVGNAGWQLYNGYGNSNLGYGFNNNNVQQQQTSNNNGFQATSDYNSLLQQYSLNSANYYDRDSSYASVPDYAQESYAPVATYGTGSVAVENLNSSPALSALALLGFLYFLNLIQDVLQNNNGRRRRSLKPGEDHLEEEEEEEEGYYSTSYLEEGQLPGDFQEEQPHLTDVTQQEGAEVEARERQDRLVKVSQATPRSFSFLENFFIKLPQALGLRYKYPIERDGRDENPMGMGGFITTRLKMISSIMSFLQDPSPSRVRRTAQDFGLVGSMMGEEGIGSWLRSSIKSVQPLIREALQEYTKPKEYFSWDEDNTIQKESQNKSSLSSDKLINVTDSDGTDSDNRKKRHTYTMNAWYEDLGGRNVEVSSGVGGLAAKAMSLLGGGEELQEAVKNDGVPTFVELIQSLDGGHPHCLQRALCHMNSHSKKLSLMSRLAIQLLSTNVAEISTSASAAEDNYRAIKAGQQGEDCNKSFIDCKTLRISRND